VTSRTLAAVLLLLLIGAASCKGKSNDTPAPQPSTSPSATPPFTLKGDGFELLLPQGFKAHPKQATMEEVGAVGGSYELIVATHPVDLAKASANGVAFDDVFKELGDVRRQAALEFAANETDVDAIQPQEINGMQAYVFKGRLSKPPFEKASVFSALVALPGFKAGSTTLRTLLSFSLYDYKGSPPAELDRFARGLLKPLKAQ
jgi:hypothetical protein